MAIRCASKAIIINNGAVLLNKCKNEEGHIYYDLPGGGQNVYESLEEALVREVKEETGYDVRVDKFVALAEEIYTILTVVELRLSVKPFLFTMLTVNFFVRRALLTIQSQTFSVSMLLSITSFVSGQRKKRKKLLRTCLRNKELIYRK